MFFWISLMVWNLFPFKGDFSLGKARSHRVPNLGCRRDESLGWFGVSPKHCTRCDAWVGMLSWWSFQSPVVHSCCLLNQSNSLCRGMFKLNAKFDADSLLYLLSHFECDSHTVHRMLIQWHLPPPMTTTAKSSLFTHVHSSPRSLADRLQWYCANPSDYINNGRTFSRQTSYTYIGD